MTQKIYEFTLPDSGVKVRVKGIATSVVAMDVVSGSPKPPPPIAKVDYGGGDIRYEPNPADPDYINIVLPEWENEVELKRTRLTLKRALVKNLSDEEKDAVKEVRDDYLDEGITLERSDKMVWLKHLACGSDRDLVELFKFIGERGEPNSKPARDSFQGNVSGS